MASLSPASRRKEELALERDRQEEAARLYIKASKRAKRELQKAHAAAMARH